MPEKRIEGEVEHISLMIGKATLEELEKLVGKGIYPSISEAVRSILRKEVLRY